MKKIFKPFDEKLIQEEQKSHHVIRMIRNVPDADPPQGLEERVMSSLPPRKTVPQWRKLYRLALTPQTVRFTPLKLVTSVICCALVLFFVTVWFNGDNASRQALNTADMRIPEAHFYMGRSLLASNQPEKALPYLEKAVALSPDQADFHFWLGVAHWAHKDFIEERNQYAQAIDLEPDHILANLYLGHNFMDRGEWDKALVQYDKVLAVDPNLPHALYNRGLIFRNLGKTAEETIVWKEYLKVNQRGKWAVRAAEHLNDLGDFSYGIHPIGPVRIVIKRPSFSASDTLLPDCLSSLDQIGYVLGNNPNLYVHVVVYFKDNHKRALARAKTIKGYLTRKYPSVDPARIKISWFSCAEKIVANDKTFLLNESVRFIGLTTNKKEII
ncbi:MAG: tetratricopeptide repeat protein [Deltaproteobacteria bacterium]|nr:tetratricopeptide repeat protein [Deltaproteobacteria bacterium]